HFTHLIMSLHCFHIPRLSVILFFFLLPLRRPRSTLFPYTTLFRSQHQRYQLVAVIDRKSLADHAANRQADIVNLADAERIDDRRDRKSTRLNSSHVAISYAVFCLKKKIRRAAALFFHDVFVRRNTT